MFQTKKTLLFGFIICLIALGIQSFKKQDQQQEPKLKNIKVFPANTSFKEVDDAMDKFKMALGVRCGYCHAPSKDNPRKYDMASDDNPKKEITRNMMRMTWELNQKYISQIPHADTTKVQMVTCNTCHRGQAKPVVPELTAQPRKTPPPPPPPAK
jgi:hypothetical protein